MSLRDKIETDYKNALKSKDKNKISTYRLILSGIKDLDISNRSGPDKKETDDNDIKKLASKDKVVFAKTLNDLFNHLYKESVLLFR